MSIHPPRRRSTRTKKDVKTKKWHLALQNGDADESIVGGFFPLASQRRLPALKPFLIGLFCWHAKALVNSSFRCHPLRLPEEVEGRPSLPRLKHVFCVCFCVSSWPQPTPKALFSEKNFLFSENFPILIFWFNFPRRRLRYIRAVFRFVSHYFRCLLGSISLVLRLT